MGFFGVCVCVLMVGGVWSVGHENELPPIISEYDVKVVVCVLLTGADWDLCVIQN